MAAAWATVYLNMVLVVCGHLWGPFFRFIDEGKKEESIWFGTAETIFRTLIGNFATNDRVSLQRRNRGVVEEKLAFQHTSQ